MPRLAFVIIGLSLLAARAVARDGRPDWIDGESLEWPRHRYVVGVGSAEDRATAENRARAEIARVFAARVLSTTVSSASESTATAHGSSATVAQVAVSDETRSSTDKVLEGVEIVTAWEEAATRRVFALAVLDRRSGAERLRARLADLDAAARPAKAELASTSDRVAAALAGMRVWALARRREPLVADLRILDPAAASGAALVQAEAAAREALSRVTVAVAPVGNDASVVAEGISRGLAAVGLRPGTSNVDAADLVVETVSTGEDLGLRDGWFWYRTNASVVVRSVRTGQVIVALEETARETARINGEARRRSERSAADRIAEQLPLGFLAWAER